MNIIGELWNAHNDFPKYLISNLGRVAGAGGKLMHPYKDRQRKDGPITCLKLTIKPPFGKVKTMKVHRLVMDVFGPVCPGADYTIDHRDRNPENNCIDNLRWATRFEQNKNRKNTRAAAYKKLSMQDIENIYQMTKTKSLTEISAEIKIDKVTIHKILRFVHPKY